MISPALARVTAVREPVWTPKNADRLLKWAEAAKLEQEAKGRYLAADSLVKWAQHNRHTAVAA